jgi:hypothetical protein
MTILIKPSSFALPYACRKWIEHSILGGKWLHGAAPKDLAPGLFRLTRYKNRFVVVELRNRNWIRSLSTINTLELLQEFIMLYTTLDSVHLTDQSGEVFWRWTSNGKFTVASAYNCQFKGAYTFFPAKDVWKAFTEPKCRFFTWLVLHNRALTADVMQKKNWPCDSFCALCFYIHENADHMLCKCNYTEALWRSVSNNLDLPPYDSVCHLVSPVDWVIFVSASGDRATRTKRLGNLFFFWWHVWKERNRIIFDGKEQSVAFIANQLLQDIKLYSEAMS